MPIKDLFRSDVTRDIPPVVYVHEQSPAKLEAEVSEYIITGGWPSDHPNHRRVPNGIHEEYVRLLTAISNDLKKRNGTDLPACWISGFYGSGKSSFAKLLGLALDGRELPGGRSLAEAWLQRDTSPKARDLQKAWSDLRKSIDPLAVVFDIGATARDNEHIHAAAVRQLQRRLGYCKTEPAVADYELKLEREGHWAEFERIAHATLGRPWADVKDKQFADEAFSQVMSVMRRDLFTDPMRWFELHAGTSRRAASPEEAVSAIQDMLKLRTRNATLFLVIDEVSQYLQAHSDRVDRMRAFATALGAKLRGKAWLLALGQQKLEEEAEGSFLDWAKERFPRHLRVHLAPTNIRDVVHKRLLQKKTEAEPALRKLFEENRPFLKNYAFGCDAITAEEFVDVYPMLPAHIDLILQITSALRARSARAQGDDQAIRGLLQLLGELFRTQKLAEKEPGVLVTLDQVYDVQHTALDSDVQDSMARLLGQCTGDGDELKVRAAKAVALLELIQDVRPTDAKLVAQCLYDRVDRGNNVPAVTEALEELRHLNLLGYSEKEGYKIQSTAGEEWARERYDLPVAGKTRSEIVKETLVRLIADPERPRFSGRPFPWAAVYSDGREANDVSVQAERGEAAVWVDFRYVTREEQAESQWLRRSNEEALYNRLVWVVGNRERLEDLAFELGRSEAMLQKYRGRRESLSAAKKTLLTQEENRRDDLLEAMRSAAAEAWMTGRMYFRGRGFSPKEHGSAFATALVGTGSRILPDLFTQFVAIQVDPSEILQLIEKELVAPSPKFVGNENLGLLELDAGRYVPTCSGAAPSRIMAYIEQATGVVGGPLLTHFGKPPCGYTQGVVKACVIGLLRTGKVKVQPEGGNEITGVRDAGVRELIERDRDFRRATIFPSGADDVGVTARNRICRFFEDRLGVKLDREDQAIADAVAERFPPLAKRLREVEEMLARLPGRAARITGMEEGPLDEMAFHKLSEALERCIRVMRQTKPAVTEVKRRLDALNDGVQQLKVYEAELTDDAIRAVRDASDVLDYQVNQLRESGAETSEVAEAAKRASEQLSSATPWRDILAIEPDLQAIRTAYVIERTRLLAWQEQHAEQARVRVKTRSGFSTLTGDQSHRVLRPLAKAVTDTTPEAVAPTLLELRDRFTLALQRAEAEANDILDGLLSEGDKPMIQTLDLGLRNREVVSEADIEALIEEIRARLMEQLRAGTRVRLV